MTMSRTAFSFIWTCMVLLGRAGGVSAEETVLPEGDARASIASRHFPDRVHEFVWRNWNAVEPAKLATILGASLEDVTAMAGSMGLPAPDAIPPEMKTRGYISLIRRNWHLLPYPQLLELLEMTPQRLAFTLREDDFLWVKLGRVKPKCEPLGYQAPDEAARNRAAEIRRVVEEYFGEEIRRPSEPRFDFRFDIDKNETEIVEIQKRLEKVERDLKNVKLYTIRYIKDLLKKYGKLFPRKTRIGEIEELDRRAIAAKQVKVGFDPNTGFVGTKVSGEEVLECSNFDKLLLIFSDGIYHVTSVPEKQFVHQNESRLVFFGIADKETVFNVVYKDQANNLCYAKRFVVKQFILDKEYQFFGDGMSLEYLSTEEDPLLELRFIPRVKQKVKKMEFRFDSVLIKGVGARGIRISNRGVKKIVVRGRN